MAPNSLFTTNCAMHSASTPTSAILTALGKRAGSKTPTAGSDDFCRVEQICSSARRSRSTPSLDNATIPRANALASKLQLSYSTIICCTSNVNPPDPKNWNDGVVPGVNDTEVIKMAVGGPVGGTINVGSMMLLGPETITFTGTLNTIGFGGCSGLMVCDNAIAIFAPGATFSDGNTLIVRNDVRGTL